MKNLTVKILARWMCSDSTGGFSFWICWPVYSVSGMATDQFSFFCLFKKRWDRLASTIAAGTTLKFCCQVFHMSSPDRHFHLWKSEPKNVLVTLLVPNQLMDQYKRAVGWTTSFSAEIARRMELTVLSSFNHSGMFLLRRFKAKKILRMTSSEIQFIERSLLNWDPAFLAFPSSMDLWRDEGANGTQPSV